MKLGSKILIVSLAYCLVALSHSIYDLNDMNERGETEFFNQIGGTHITIVYFYGTLCGSPCDQIEPILNELHDFYEFSNINFIMADYYYFNENYENVIRESGVDDIDPPAFAVYNFEAELVANLVGDDVNDANLVALVEKYAGTPFVPSN